MPFNMMVVALMLSLIFFSTPYITYNKVICLLEKKKPDIMMMLVRIMLSMSMMTILKILLMMMTMLMMTIMLIILMLMVSTMDGDNADDG